MIVAGIDENGYGPRLGMLCLTATVFELRAGYRPAELWTLPGEARVCDSKKMTSFRNLKGGEKTVLTYMAMLNGRLPRSVGELLSGVSFRDPRSLAEKCPPACRAVCWGEDEGLPCFGKADPERVKADAEGTLKRLEGLSGRFLKASTYICCPNEFNSSIGDDCNKLNLEFRILEAILRRIRGEYGGEALFLCDKLGGARDYSQFFGYLGGFKMLSREESRDESRYVLEGFGELRFVKGGDSLHFPIALSSVFGKYVREIFVRRTNRFFMSRIPGLEEASGYHDPATAEFVRKTEALRGELGIPPSCFERKR